MRGWLQGGLAAMGLIAAVSVFVAWRAAQRNALRLQGELKASQEALAAATNRQESRDADLKQMLATTRREKAAVRTPAEVVKALPEVLYLPKPLTLASPQEQTIEGRAGTPNQEQVEKIDGAPQIRMPVEDLKPLYDFALDCKSCQAQLRAAQADLKDEQLKSHTITKERDEALKVAKGGSVMRRVVRAAKWFVIGAAAGAAAAKLGR